MLLHGLRLAQALQSSSTTILKSAQGPRDPVPAWLGAKLAVFVSGQQKRVEVADDVPRTSGRAPYIALRNCAPSAFPALLVRRALI